MDDGCGASPAEALNNVFAYINRVIVMKVSHLVCLSVAFEHVGTRQVRTEASIWVLPFMKSSWKRTWMATACPARTGKGLS